MTMLEESKVFGTDGNRCNSYWRISFINDDRNEDIANGCKSIINRVALTFFDLSFNCSRSFVEEGS